MRRQILLIIFLLSSASIAAQIHDDPEEAFAEAGISHKMLLLVFAGSDWCAPCIRFEKTILTDGSFLNYAGDRLVVLRADFPQRNKYPKELRMKYDALAEQYNPRGLFPHLLLIRPDRSVVSILVYNEEAVEDFVSMIDSQLKDEQAR